MIPTLLAQHSLRAVSRKPVSHALHCAPRWCRGLASEVPPVTATNRAETSKKRFWKEVGIESKDGVLSVTLDKRSLKTPDGNKLAVPQEKRLLATLIANEWDNQILLLKQHALPMTSITARAIDAMDNEETRKEVRAALLKYFDTDTICFFSDHPPALAELQAEHWNPVIAWAREKFGIEIRTTNTIMFEPQPAESKVVLDEVMQTFDRWQMAALERATYTTKSFLLAMALVHKQITAEQAAVAAQVEVSSQIQKWGEVEDSHDVDYHDVRRHVGSAAIVLADI
ncbi:ATP12-domain-containing protein [Peniophora sp. CONT]|nr:ATP12-domain-containing protein [Peniophora sp. CONT]